MDVLVSCSVRSISKSSGRMRTGVPAPWRVIALRSVRPTSRWNGIAELVGLVLVGALVTEAGTFDLVPSGTVLEQPLEQVAERPLTDAPDALGRELHAPFPLLDQAGFLELLRELGELVERPRGIVAEQVAHLVEIDFGELAGVRRVAQHVLERVDVAELVEHAAHLIERHRLVTAERHPLAPTHLRERVAQVLPELVDLPAQIHVVEQRVRHLLQLRALLGAHRVEELLHLRHRTRHRLEQLVERLGVVGEEVAEAVHEAGEVGFLTAARAARASDSAPRACPSCARAARATSPTCPAATD